jgi:F-type H+-transporting ATPase subunit delta
MVSGQMVTAGVAGRYANALFELAREDGQIDKVEQQLVGFQTALSESADLTRMTKSPVFTQEQQARAVRVIADTAGITGISRNFLELLAARRRLMFVSDMIRAYRSLAAQHRGEIEAEVTVAAAMGEEQHAAVAEAVKAFAGQDVKINLRIDPSILGGIIVRIGSRMIDNSLRSKLNRLKYAMKEVG